MLTGVELRDAKDEPYKQHYMFGGKGALPADSHGKPWDGSYVHSSGDLIEDLTHNYFLESGARSGKLRVYEMVRPSRGARADGLPARAAAASTRSPTHGRSSI